MVVFCVATSHVQPVIKFFLSTLIYIDIFCESNFFSAFFSLPFFSLFLCDCRPITHRHRIATMNQIIIQIRTFDNIHNRTARHPTATERMKVDNSAVVWWWTFYIIAQRLRMWRKEKNSYVMQLEINNFKKH